MRGNDNLEREVAAIGVLPREELVVRWHKTYGCPPPKGINRLLLERSAAWNLQAKKLGRLSGAARAGLRLGSRTHKKTPRSTTPGGGADGIVHATSMNVPPPQETLPIAYQKSFAPALAVAGFILRVLPPREALHSTCATSKNART